MTKCTSCGVEIPEGEERVVKARKDPNSLIILCATCADRVSEVFEAKTKTLNLKNALISGVVASVISAIVWYGIVAITSFQVGYLAIGVGWLVGQSIVIGSGGGRGIVLQGMSVALTTFAMVLSEYLIVRHVAVQVLAAEGSQQLPLLLPLDVALGMISHSISANPLTLLFWAIAVFTAYRIPG